MNKLWIRALSTNKHLSSKVNADFLLGSMYSNATHFFSISWATILLTQKGQLLISYLYLLLKKIHFKGKQVEI